MTLKAEKDIDIRFSEVDSMNVVWHGSYPLYFEDAREAFGKKYGLEYTTIFDNGYFAPLVELSFKYKRAIRYGQSVTIEITYKYTEAAKIVFEYEIKDKKTGMQMATGMSTQVFMDRKYELVWESPEFYKNWQKKWKLTGEE